MTRELAARFLTGVAALGYLGTAAFHGTGYEFVVGKAKDVPGMLGQIMPALWLVFSVDLSVLGLILGVLTLRPADVARPILVIAALCPFAVAGLQIRFIGFIPPTGLLITLGILTWAGAAVWPRRSSPPSQTSSATRRLLV